MSLAPYPRDLVGYGGKPPAWKQPNGARVAVSMVINFEEGAELSAGDGDSASERQAEITSIIEPGKWDQSTEQMFAYGMRAGIWRMLDWLKRHDRRITFYMCGRAIERAPQIARAIVEAGHEPASHGWLWRPQSKIRDFECDRIGERIQLRARFSGVDRVLIDVDAGDTARAAERRSHRQHARSGSEIEHEAIADVDVRQQPQAHARRRVMPGAEAHRRLDDDHGRADAVGRQIPRRRDDEPAGANGLERLLRSRRPIFIRQIDAFDRD